MATKLIDLIESINADDLPTNEFSIEDKDPMVILGKLNEVIAYLQTLQATINVSDSKANEALQKAIEAVADATQALSVANGIDTKATQALTNAIEAVETANTALSASNTALSTANTAISTTNTALSSANSAVETANGALDTAETAENKADTAITTANGAKTTAEGIDAKATTALSNSQTAVITANTAETIAQEALDQVVAGQGTKVYRDTQLLTSLDIKPIEDDITNNATAINALDNAKVDKVSGKQLSTEDFTTTEKNKLAGLNNYDDTQVRANITALTNAVNALDNAKVDKVSGKQLSTEDFTTTEKNKLAGLNNYDDTQVRANITALTNELANNVVKTSGDQVIGDLKNFSSLYFNSAQVMTHNNFEYEKLNSGYRIEIFTDNTKKHSLLLVQWGLSAKRTTNGDVTITYPRPYKNTNYGLVQVAQTEYKNQNESPTIVSRSTTGCVLNDWNNRASSWVAIGIGADR